MTLPPGINERRQDCIDHEARLDEIGAEIHKHSGWWKAIGAGLIVAIGLLANMGSSISGKLDAINAQFSSFAVSSARLEGRMDNAEREIKEIQSRHQFIDQSSVANKKR